MLSVDGIYDVAIADVATITDEDEEDNIKEGERIMSEYKSNEQGKCPKCNGLDLDYQPADFEDNMIYFRWTCKDCGQEGEEWYSMTFQGHNVYDEDGNIIDLSL